MTSRSGPRAWTLKERHYLDEQPIRHPIRRLSLFSPFHLEAWLLCLGLLFSTVSGCSDVSEWDRRCPPEERTVFIEEAATAGREFSDVFQLASDAPRIALPPLIREMQTIRLRVERLEPTPCGQTVKSEMLEAMSEIINAFSLFLRDPESEQWAVSRLQRAASRLSDSAVGLQLLGSHPELGLTPEWSIRSSFTPTPTLRPTATRRRPTPTPTPDGICHDPSEAEQLVGQRTCVCGIVEERPDFSLGGTYPVYMANGPDLMILSDGYRWLLPGMEVKVCGRFYGVPDERSVRLRVEREDQIIQQ